MKNRPFVIITDEGAAFLKNGQNVMYRNNLISISGQPETGDIVDIKTTHHDYLGSGFYHATSHIVVRILTHDQNVLINKDFFTRRVQFAYDFRRTVESRNLTNCRIIFGEADGLPGLTVDRYNDILVTQITSYGIEMHKDIIYKALFNVLRKDRQEISAIYERNDVKARQKEGLELYKGFYGDEHRPTTTVIKENGLLLNVDFENGQKTGYFLDQKSNRVLLREMAHGKRVLDCFTHTGGFALNAAKGNAKHVTAVDVSETALAEGLANAKLNRLENKVDFVQADVFDYLDTLKPGQFDIIVLDPPAFTKSRATVHQAYNGYKRINKTAMALLAGGGYLISCTCSHYMTRENYERMLREAAQEAHVTLKQISVTQQNHDHPILWSHDQETSYLKFYIFQII